MTPHAIAEAWNNVSEALRANPDKARAKYAPATATLESGLMCRVAGPSGELVETENSAIVALAIDGDLKSGDFDAPTRRLCCNDGRAACGQRRSE